MILKPFLDNDDDNVEWASNEKKNPTKSAIVGKKSAGLMISLDYTSEIEKGHLYWVQDSNGINRTRTNHEFPVVRKYVAICQKIEKRNGNVNT